MLPREETKYTLEQYLELDHESEEKLEFWDGCITNESKDNLNHNVIQGNTLIALKSKCRKELCRIFLSHMRIKVPACPPYRYPDLSALCEEVEIESLGKQELLVNPQLIVEILSPSSSVFDQGDKFTYYKSIKSFTEYILIAQHRPKVTQFIKQSDNSWLQHEFTNLDVSFHIDSLDCEIALSEIYENVEFPEPSRRFDLISVRES